MKILAFSHDSGLYGTQRSLLTLLLGLKEKGHHIRLCSPTSGLIIDEAKRWGLDNRIVPFPLPKLGLRHLWQFAVLTHRGSAKILYEVESFQPDVILFNTVACLSPAIILRNHKTRKIWSVRETTILRALVSYAIAALSDLSVANCHFIAGQYPILQKKNHLRTVVNGIFAEAMGEGSTQVEIHGSNRGKRVLFAGSLVPHKGVGTLLHGAKIALERGCDFHLDIFGEGRLFEQIQGFIRKHRLCEKVHLKGFVPDIRTEVAQTDVVIIPSTVEPFPRIGLEAMAFGKPIIGSAVGGIPEQVVDGKTGFLVKPGAADDLADKLAKLLKNEKLIKSFGEQGKLRQRALFSAEGYVTCYENILFPPTKENSSLTGAAE